MKKHFLSFLSVVILLVSISSSSCGNIENQEPGVALTLDDLDENSVRVFVYTDSQTNNFSHGHSYIVVGKNNSPVFTSYHFGPNLYSDTILQNISGKLFSYSDSSQIRYNIGKFQVRNLKAYLLTQTDGRAIKSYMDEVLQNASYNTTWGDHINGYEEYNLIHNNCTSFILRLLEKGERDYNFSTSIYEYPDQVVDVAPSLAPFTLLADLVQKAKQPKRYHVYDVTEISKKEVGL